MIYHGSDKHKIALFEGKQDKLTAGDNITLTPLQDGTVRIDAEGGGGTGTVTDVLVDGVSVVNQDGEAEIIMPTVPSDLDDLSDVNVSSLSDGEVLKYNSTTQKWENGEAGGDKFAPIIYSLEEREIGVWTDGKPLYEKTINFTHSTSWDGNRYDIAHGIADIDSCVDIIGRFVNADNKSIICGGTTRTNGDNYSSNSNIASGLSLNACSFDRTNISIIMGSTFYQYGVTFNVVATLRYTKTTDVPGSGTWGTVPMVHYDGNEKVIGTWFGDTLYEKTYHYTGTLNAHSWVTIDSSRLPSNTPYFSVTNICLLSTELSQNAKFSGYNTSIPFDIALSTAEQLYFENKSNFKIYEFFVTVQYTKTTD